MTDIAYHAHVRAWLESVLEEDKGNVLAKGWIKKIDEAEDKDAAAKEVVEEFGGHMETIKAAFKALFG